MTTAPCRQTNVGQSDCIIHVRYVLAIWTARFFLLSLSGIQNNVKMSSKGGEEQTDKRARKNAGWQHSSACTYVPTLENKLA
jgi:hypothetical protein